MNRWFVGILFLATGIFSIFFWLKGRSGPLLQPYKVSYNVQSSRTDITKDTSESTSTFVKTLRDTLDSSQGRYGVYVYRLAEDKGYGINQDVIFPAASIMKVPIMTAVLQQVDAGALQLTDTYTLTAADIRTGSGPIEFMAPGTKLTVEYLLKVSGQNSDNTAPVALTKLVGQSTIVQMISKLGMIKTDFGANTTTASDLTAMWKTLYSGKLLSQASHDLLWTDLQKSIYEDRIPQGIPKDTIVIHKVGSDLDIWADSGIVMSSNPLVITILNQGVDLSESKLMVPKLAKMIWVFETSRTPGQKP